MRRRYKKFARKIYRFLRNPRRRRNNRLHGWLGSRVLNRHLWKPERHPVAVGMAIGLAVAMLPPIPVQMLLAAILAVLLSGNIPIAAAACWVSNPISWAPILMLQRAIGDWALRPGDFDSLHPNIHTLRCTALGAIAMAIVLAPLGYFLVYVLWDLFGWVARRFVPVARAKPDRALLANEPREHKEPLATTTEP